MFWRNWIVLYVVLDSCLKCLNTILFVLWIHKFFILKLFLCLFGTLFKNVIAKQTNGMSKFFLIQFLKSKLHFSFNFWNMGLKKWVLADISNLLSVFPTQPYCLRKLLLWLAFSLYFKFLFLLYTSLHCKIIPVTPKCIPGLKNIVSNFTQLFTI